MSATLTIGSTNIDVIVRANSESKPHHKDRMGTVSIEVGGSATNAALGFHRLGCRSRLLTAMARSPLSSMLQSWLQNSGIDLICDDLPTSDLGAFVAQLNAKGDLENAISQTPVERHTFTSETLARALAGIEVVVADANLSEETLLDVANATQALRIPLAVMTVSEDKAQRVLAVRGKIQMILANHLEAEKLMSEIGATDPGEIAEHMQCLVIVTRGERGASAYFPDGRKERIKAPVLDNPKNYLGFGDAMTSGLALGVLGRGLGVQEATDQFAEGLIREIATSTSCNGMPGAIANIVEVLVDKGQRDHLTHLLLRGGFEDAFRRLKGPTNTLLAIDVDRFKAVNDQHGHESGDKVLALIAQVILDNTRTDDLAARYGGDEFSLILTNTPTSEARFVADRIRGAVEAANLYGVTLSIGVAAILPEDTLATVMARADGSMYEAKRSGRNKVVLVD
ncbi:PfkB family carbohydrate kinase [Herbaspirillum sp. RV1423]|uniref:PfkB family carbohydrate kinase n=1 Tax=Herbaspirillum sp. RV1423 TaxID=1443993 RepID=UPI0009DF4291|nr:PfkB family carbohydrate kinase [Herbaspirillum sp. RV1423]